MSKCVPLPCVTTLRALLAYDENTGALTWKCRVNRGVHAGDLAGRKYKGSRYLRVKIEGRGYIAHRVIWKIKTGNEPSEVMDHIDCDPFNNRWSNLREATPTLNNYNRKLPKNNHSGTKGVHWNSADKRWKAVISVDGKQLYLGYFTNKDDAAAAVNAVRPDLHGEFARFA